MAYHLGKHLMVQIMCFPDFWIRCDLHHWMYSTLLIEQLTFYYTAAPSSSPKHTIYAFIIYSICATFVM